MRPDLGPVVAVEPGLMSGRPTIEIRYCAGVCCAREPSFELSYPDGSSRLWCSKDVGDEILRVGGSAVVRILDRDETERKTA